MNIADFYKKVDVSVAVARIVFNYLSSHYANKNISEIAETSSGGTPTRGNPEYYGGGIPWLKSGELNDSVIQNCEEYITEKGLKSSSAKLFAKGTLLVAMYGATAGKVGILDFDAATNQAVCAVFPDGRVKRDYLFWYLRQQRFTFIELSRGGAQPNISQTVINKAHVPVPPIEIQQQVVDFLTVVENEKRIDSELVLSEEVAQNITRYFKIRTEASRVEDSIQQQQSLLAKLRQSILQEAVQGKLTERWRAERNGLKQAGAGQVAGSNPVGGSSNDYQTPIENPVTPGGTGSSPVRTANRSDETGAELLARIRAEKAELIRQGKLRKEKPLPPITDAEKPFDLPEGWVWCRFAEIAEIKSNLVNPFDYPSLPHIAPDNIQKNTGKLLEYNSVTEDEVISANHYFFSGQLIYSKVRPQLNKVILVSFEGLCSADMYPIEAYIKTEYLHLYMLSATFLSEVDKYDNRVKMPKINQNQLNNIPVPLPSIAEQQAIIPQVERTLAHVSTLVAENRRQQAEVGRLMQAVLREAFAGKEVVEN